MITRSYETRQYDLLNPYAEKRQTILFGGTSDKSIPVSELLDAYGIEVKVYSRCFMNLCVSEAQELYDKYVNPLFPDSVLIHIGEGDLIGFSRDSHLFDADLTSLLLHIKELSPKCEITLISFSDDRIYHDLNRHLKQIADSVKCIYADITVGQIWNPESAKQVREFVSMMGCKSKVQSRDIVRALYSI